LGEFVEVRTTGGWAQIKLMDDSMQRIRSTRVPDTVPDDIVVFALATLVDIARHGKTEAGRMTAAAVLRAHRARSN
jgi:hypothetical protein